MDWCSNSTPEPGGITTLRWPPVSARTWAPIFPKAADYVGSIKPLLDRFGNDTALTIVVYTLDETTYSRELAPLAGHYPAFGSALPGGSTTARRDCGGTTAL